MAAARRVLPCLFVALVALATVRPGLGGIEQAGSPLATDSLSGPMFDAADLGPGRLAVQTVQVANEGDAPGRFVLSASALGRLAAALELTVFDSAWRVVYRGSLADLEASLGIIGPGESRAYRFVAKLSSDVGGDLAGHAASATFAWTATPA